MRRGNRSNIGHAQIRQTGIDRGPVCAVVTASVNAASECRRIQRDRGGRVEVQHVPNQAALGKRAIDAPAVGGK